jgi:hypothetical protein
MRKMLKVVPQIRRHITGARRRDGTTDPGSVVLFRVPVGVCA